MLPLFYEHLKERIASNPLLRLTTQWRRETEARKLILCHAVFLQRKKYRLI